MADLEQDNSWYMLEASIVRIENILKDRTHPVGDDIRGWGTSATTLLQTARKYHREEPAVGYICMAEALVYVTGMLQTTNTELGNAQEMIGKLQDGAPSGRGRRGGQ